MANFDQVARFNEGDVVEISTVQGWREGVVTRVNYVNVPEYDITGYHYDVNYVPKWAANKRFGYKAYSTVCSGPAIRNK